MTIAKVGPLIAVDGSRQGLGEFYAKMAGKRFVVTVNDDKGGIDEAIGYGGANWTYVYRKTGAPFDVPNYEIYPLDAAEDWWDAIIPHLEGVPTNVWIHAGNELDKNRADWLGWWGFHIARMALDFGRRVCLFNFAAGEPELSHWQEGGMVQFLKMAALHRHDVAVGLHEYSYEVEDAIPGGWDVAETHDTIPAIMRGAPWMVGRYQFLLGICDEMNISYPSILITETGWKLDQIPDRDRALRDIEILTRLYNSSDEVLGAGLWYSGGGAEWKGICYDVEKLFPAWGDYNASLADDDDPVVDPLPVEGEIDLMDYLVGEPDVQHVLQCDFGNYFRGTQTLCTRCFNDGVYGQQKDSEQEVIYFDEHYVYRDVDTSPGDHNGRNAFYHMSEDGAVRGAFWCNRIVRIGDVLDRHPFVWHRYADDCEVFASGQVSSQLRVASRTLTFTGWGGYLFNRPTVELHWLVDGQVVERYFYGQGRGLIAWEETNRHWRSAICEEHYDRPSMPAPDWPGCMPTPNMTELYYRDDAPAPYPPPEEDPCEYERVFHLLDESIDPDSSEAETVWRLALKMRSTVGYSWHDAVVSNRCLLKRTVYTWDMPALTCLKLASFQALLFPGKVTFVHRSTDDPHLDWEG